MKLNVRTILRDKTNTNIHNNGMCDYIAYEIREYQNKQKEEIDNLCEKYWLVKGENNKILDEQNIFLDSKIYSIKKNVVVKEFPCIDIEKINGDIFYVKQGSFKGNITELTVYKNGQPIEEVYKNSNIDWEKCEYKACQFIKVDEHLIFALIVHDKYSLDYNLYLFKYEETENIFEIIATFNKVEEIIGFYCKNGMTAIQTSQGDFGFHRVEQVHILEFVSDEQEFE